MVKRRGARHVSKSNREKSDLHPSHNFSQRPERGKAAKESAGYREEFASERGLTITKLGGDRGRWEIRSKSTNKLLVLFNNNTKECVTTNNRIVDLPKSLYDAMRLAVDIEFETAGISIGSRVKLKELGDNSIEEYEIVATGGENYEAQVPRILPNCPMALKLLGAKLGDVVEVQLPKSLARYEVLEIKPLE